MDIYSLCPCGSGKKLKFCCSDLIDDIKKIQRMIEGDQPRAALNHIVQTLRKSPNRASLLDLQAMLQLLLGETSAAEQTIKHFLEVEPKNSSAHAHQAMLLAEQENPLAAIDALQTALELLDVDMPNRVLESIGAVGHALVKSGDLVSAREHLWLYESIAGEYDDHKALEVLVTMNQMAELPLLLRDRLLLRSLPDDHPAFNEMQRIEQLASSGRWRQAALQLDDILPDHLDEPIFFYNRALLSGYLGDRKNFVAGLRLYARQSIATGDAIEAEAIAQLVDPELRDEPPGAVRQVHDLLDEDAFIQRMTDHNQALILPISRKELEVIKGPKPRTSWVLLDRPEPQQTEQLSRADIPNVLGFVSHFGRQTDRQERVELVTVRNDWFAKAVEVFQDIAGDSVGPLVEEVDLGPIENVSDPALTWRWHLPRNLSPQQRQDLLKEERRAALLDRWPRAARAALGGKTPQEASSVEELQLPLLAAIFILELESADASQDATFAELRQQLGVPSFEPFRAEQVAPNEIPITQLHRMDLSPIDSEDLFVLYQRCILVNAPRATQTLVREALRRDEFAEYVPFEKLYEQLFSTQLDSQDAIEVLEDARGWSHQQGESCGRWDLLELQVHIQDRNSEGANRVLEHLRTQHMDEPEIAEQVYQLLYMIGAIPQQGKAASVSPAPAVTTPPAGEPESAIWTPGGESQASGKGKLWTPD